MARRGRPRKQPDLKVVKGAFAVGKQADSEKKKGKPVLAPNKPDRPEHLDQLEAKIWDELVAHLHTIGSLQKCDEGTLVAYCTAYARLIRNKKALEKHRTTHGDDFYETEGRHGLVIRTHPAVGIIEKTEKTIRALAVEFGMTPAGRKGLGFDTIQLSLPLSMPDERNPKDPTSGLCS